MIEAVLAFLFGVALVLSWVLMYYTGKAAGIKTQKSLYEIITGRKPPVE